MSFSFAHRPRIRKRARFDQCMGNGAVGTNVWHSDVQQSRMRHLELTCAP
jgi:hypothetical protein